MFRSVRLFSVQGPWPDSEHQLAEALATAPFSPCGPLTERSSGWEPPAGDEGSPLARRVGGADLLRLRTQLRVLPAAAVDEALETRVAEYRARTREEPGRRAKRQLKEQTRDELLPRALLRSERIRGFCLPTERVLGVESTGDARAQRFIDHLRAPLGGLVVKPLAFKRSIGDLLTRILLDDAPPDFSVGRECRLQDPSDRKSTARFADMDLAHSAVRRCLKDAMEPTHLAIGFANVMSCVLDGNGAIGKLRFAGIDSSDERASDDDPLARFDAESVLLTGTLRQLVERLNRLLGAAD